MGLLCLLINCCCSSRLWDLAYLFLREEFCRYLQHHYHHYPSSRTRYENKHRDYRHYHIEVIIIHFGGTSIADTSIIVSFIAIAVVGLYFCRSGYVALLINVASTILVGVIALMITPNLNICDDVIFMLLCLGVLVTASTTSPITLKTNYKVLVMTVLLLTNTMLVRFLCPLAIILVQYAAPQI